MAKKMEYGNYLHGGDYYPFGDRRALLWFDVEIQ